MYFASNFTYSGSWDVYGGLGGNNVGNGSSGAAYFYHTGKYKIDQVDIRPCTLPVTLPTLAAGMCKVV